MVPEVSTFSGLQLLIQGAITLLTAAGGVKVALNGIYKRLDRAENKQDEQGKLIVDGVQRIAKIEGMLSKE